MAASWRSRWRLPVAANSGSASALPAYAPLKSLNDRYITMLVALKSRAPTDTPTACITLAPLPVAAEAAIAAIKGALNIDIGDPKV